MTDQLQTHTRSVELSLADDGLTVTSRIFPIGESAHVREINSLTGELEEYDELFLPNCTARMRQAAAVRGGPRWIELTRDHREDFDSLWGYATTLEEGPDGVDCTFRLHDDDPGRLAKVRSMLVTSHDGMSIEFVDKAPPRVEGSLVSRRQIHVTRVTATPIPAYSSARVLSLRSEDPNLFEVGTPNLDAVRAILANLAPPCPAPAAEA